MNGGRLHAVGREQAPTASRCITMAPLKRAGAGVQSVSAIYNCSWPAGGRFPQATQQQLGKGNG
jgi:hypothetical protein